MASPESCDLMAGGRSPHPGSAISGVAVLRRAERTRTRLPEPQPPAPGASGRPGAAPDDAGDGPARRATTPPPSGTTATLCDDTCGTLTCLQLFCQTGCVP